MKIRKYVTMSAALVGLALGSTVLRAGEIPVLRGTFELPAAAYWGNTLLQPGQYTITMNTEIRDIAHVPVVRLTGEGVNLSLLAITRPGPEDDRNYLEIVQVGDAYVVRAFDAGIIGESFTFGVSKSVKAKTLRASAEPAMSVPVSTGAGF